MNDLEKSEIIEKIKHDRIESIEGKRIKRKPKTETKTPEIAEPIEVETEIKTENSELNWKFYLAVIATVPILIAIGFWIGYAFAS